MLRKFFTENRAAKLGSLFVAIGLWVFALSSGSVTKTGFFPGDIPVVVEHIPDNLSATLNVDTIRVRISADDAVWRQLKNSSFVATIDLRGQSAGVINAPVLVQVLASNVQLLEISPKTVAVQLEAVTSRSEPVSVKTQGEPAAGFFPTDAVADPATITVSGPVSSMDRLDHVTAVIDVAGASTAKEGMVEVQAIDASGHELQGLTLSPTKVKVTQKLTKLAATKSVGVEVITTGTPVAGKLISPTATNPVTVLIAGSDQQLANIDSIPTNPIDISKITQKATIKGTLNLPKGITVSNGQEVQVTFDVTDRNSAQTVSAQVNLVGLPADRRLVSIDPAAPTVVVTGTSAKLASLVPADVSYSIDASGFTAGAHQITLNPSQLKLPDGVTFSQQITTIITITVN